MPGIFNSDIFSTTIFNTGVSAPAVSSAVSIGGGRPAWRSETEARARRKSIEKFLLQKRNQEEQLKKNVKKLERKKRESPEPDLFETRIAEALQALERVKSEIHAKRMELLNVGDYIDQIIDSWETEEDEDDWLLLQ